MTSEEKEKLSEIIGYAGEESYSLYPVEVWALNRALLNLHFDLNFNYENLLKSMLIWD